MSIVKIPIVSYWSDGGDGGGSITLYNTLEELKVDRFAPDGWGPIEECERRFQSALAGDDPYADGEISNLTLELEVGKDGSIRLSQDLHLHYGQ